MQCLQERLTQGGRHTLTESERTGKIYFMQNGNDKKAGVAHSSENIYTFT